MDGLFQEMLGASNVDIDTNVDIVFAIDATESMQPLIDKVKSLTLSFREELEKGLKENRRIIKNLRIKVIVFRDYYVDDKYAMEESQFFILPEEKQEFYNFVSQIKAGGGGDEPESGLEALALALRSDFVKDGDKKRHVIVLFTDASAHPLEQQEDGVPSNYPSNMFKNLGDLYEASVKVHLPGRRPGNDTAELQLEFTVESSCRHSSGNVFSVHEYCRIYAKYRKKRRSCQSAGGSLHLQSKTWE